MVGGGKDREEMRILKFKKRIDIDKSIGNLKLQTFHYGSFEEGQSWGGSWQASVTRNEYIFEVLTTSK